MDSKLLSTEALLLTAAHDASRSKFALASSAVLEKIKGRDSLASVVQLVLALLGEHDAEPPRPIHLLKKQTS